MDQEDLEMGPQEDFESPLDKDPEAKRLIEDLIRTKDDLLHPEKHLGCKPERYFEDLKKDFNSIKKKLPGVIESIGKIVFKTGISKMAGGIGAATGGVLMVVGIICAPFTAGVSLGFTFTGLGLSLLGSGTSLGATIFQWYLKKKQIKGIEDIKTRFAKFIDIVKKYDEAFQACHTFFKTEKGKATLKKWIKWILKLSTPVGMGFTGFKIINTAVTTVRMLEIAEAAAAAADISRAAVWAEFGIPFTSIKFITAGTRAAVAFASIGAAVSIVMGIVDIVLGWKDVRRGKQMREDHIYQECDPDERGSQNVDDHDEMNPEGRKEIDEIRLIIQNETTTDKDKSKAATKKVQGLADEIRKNIAEIEDAINTTWVAYTDKRAEIENRMKEDQDNNFQVFEQFLREQSSGAEENIHP